jgi:hypothetical protein
VKILKEEDGSTSDRGTVDAVLVVSETLLVEVSSAGKAPQYTSF